MAKFDARLLAIYTGAGTPVKITHQSNASVSMSADMIDVTTKDSNGDREVLPGTRSWTMSCDAMLDYAAPNGVTALTAAYRSGTAIVVVLQTGVVGDRKLTGNAYISSLEITGSGQGGESVTFSITLDGTGGLTEATI